MMRLSLLRVVPAFRAARAIGTASFLSLLLLAASCEKRTEPYYERSASGAGVGGGGAPSGSSGSSETNLPHAHPSAPPQANTPSTAEARTLCGRVLETYDSETGSYTYAKLALAEGGEAWVAGPLVKLAPGQLAMANGATLQRGFPTRQRTFDELWLAQALVADGAATAQPSAPLVTNAPRAEPVEPAEGGLKIADVLARSAEFAGKSVRVRGRVTRATPMIGGMWVHLQDGSVDAARDDLTFILAEGEAELAPGEIATLEGTLSLDHEMARAHRSEAIVVEKAKKL
ncbi:MAG: hypothetical protein JNM84_13955 [Planctomycetes bacterium]|nr:hypothetical protein [Planctomycetota bacterium]